GTGTDQIEGIEEAKRLGFYTVGLDGNPNSDGANLVDEFYKVNIKSIEEVLAFIRSYRKKLDGVIAFGVDIPEILAKIAEERGPYYQLSFENAKASKNKFLAKQLLKEAGVNVPPYVGVKDISDLEDFIKEYGYPVVLKPVDNSASRGVLYLTEKIDLDWAFNESLKFVNDKSFSPPLIVEKFIEGQQLSTESIIHNGKVYTVGLSDRNYELLEKYAPLIIENGGDLPPKLFYHDSYQDMIEKIDEQIKKVVEAFNSKNGTIKGDIVVDEKGKVWVIEVAFRLSGGLFSTLEIPLNTGINFLRKAIEIQLNGETDTECLNYRVKNFVRLRYLFSEKKKGVVKDLEVPKWENVIFKVYSKVGTDLGELYNLYKLPLTKLVGYVVWDSTKEKVEKREKEILEKLKIVID
ncbi:MAG: ATP-grasp domain-containing protein, partial [Desulfonauticus sp.]|nr:ATP-grasp domain-containing protein [Desulfonauticus sp.]